ncbi:MAG: site-specific integrase [Bacteroides sp.]|nr:site-specific integrase [Bacteroides sp.]
MARVNVKGKRSASSTKCEIEIDKWDEAAGRAKGTTTEAKKINNALDKFKYELTHTYQQLNQRGAPISPKRIKDKSLGLERDKFTIIHYGKIYNENKKKLVPHQLTAKTYSRYELVISRLETFIKLTYGVDDLPIYQMTPELIADFDTYLRKTYPVGHNYTLKCMQRLKAIFKYVKNQYDRGSNVNFPDPFIEYQFRYEETDRTILTEEELITVYNKTFKSKRLGQVRDVFIFSCFTGLAYAETSNLKKEHFQTTADGKTWIIIRRGKTNAQAKILLMDIPAQILRKYEGKLINGKLLPINSNDKMNEYIAEIIALCDIDKDITYHCARHTFATTVCMITTYPYPVYKDH